MEDLVWSDQLLLLEAASQWIRTKSSDKCTPRAGNAWTPTTRQADAKRAKTWEVADVKKAWARRSRVMRRSERTPPLQGDVYKYLESLCSTRGKKYRAMYRSTQMRLSAVTEQAQEQAQWSPPQSAQHSLLAEREHV